jgi:hypothetical protein
MSLATSSKGKPGRVKIDGMTRNAGLDLPDLILASVRDRLFLQLQLADSYEYPVRSDDKDLQVPLAIFQYPVFHKQGELSEPRIEQPVVTRAEKFLGLK